MPTDRPPPGLELALTAVGMVLGIVLPLVVQRWDKRRLAPSARARAWNVATWGAALYAFGPLSALGWYWVTRHGWRKALGVPVAVGLVLVITLLGAAIEWLWTTLTAR
jgi:hypothetical protein